MDKVHVQNVDVIYERSLSTSNVEDRVKLHRDPGWKSLGVEGLGVTLGEPPKHFGKMIIECW